LNIALAQLAAYWFYRGSYEPSCIGFGLIASYINGEGHIDLHVFIPKNQQTLIEIRNFYQQKNKSEDFINRFKIGSYELESCIKVED
jgi:hypothetical protein